MATTRLANPQLADSLVSAAVAAVLQARGAPKDTGPKTLAELAHTVKPDYEESRVTQLLCRELEGLARHDYTKLMIFIPPREGKSLHSSELFPSYMLGRNPKLQIIMSSYNDDLAERNSRAVKDLVNSDRWPYTDCRVRSDVKSVAHWQTTAGGIVRAAGVSGGATGYGADILIIDDYCKNQEEAMSEPLRERAWMWYTTVARTRVMPGGLQLVLATRWHEDDLAGRILAADPHTWRVISLPMQCEDPVSDPLGRKTGEFLNARIPQNEVPKPGVDIGKTEYSALYQQNPTPLSGNMFKRDDWRFYNLEELMEVGLKPIFTTVDTAFKTQSENDWSVAATWGLFQGRAYLMDVWRERVEFAQLVVKLHEVYRKWRVPLIIEDRASGQSAIQVMSAGPEYDTKDDRVEALKKMFNLGNNPIPIMPFKIPRYSTDISLAQAATPYVQSHVVLLPKGAAWVDDFVDEHARFPSGAHNDQVRTTSMAVPRLFAIVEQDQQRNDSEWTTYRIGNAVPSERQVPSSIARDLFGR